MLLFLPGVSAQSYTPTEIKVEAAFLLNFCRYVEWPAESFPAPDAPLVMAVLGDDPFGSVLDEIFAGKTTKGRPIEVRRLDSVEETAGCHLVFVSRREKKLRKELLATVAGKPVLTVGDSDGFLEHGGGINIVTVRDNLKFEVNLKATNPVGLRVSSRILTLAHEIIREE